MFYYFNKVKLLPIINMSMKSYFTITAVCNPLWNRVWQVFQKVRPVAIIHFVRTSFISHLSEIRAFTIVLCHHFSSLHFFTWSTCAFRKEHSVIPASVTDMWWWNLLAISMFWRMVNSSMKTLLPWNGLLKSKPPKIRASVPTDFQTTATGYDWWMTKRKGFLIKSTKLHTGNLSSSIQAEQG